MHLLEVAVLDQWLFPAMAVAGANARKYFRAVKIAALAQDRDWWDQATRALGRRVRDKNRAGRAADDRRAA